MIFFRTDSNSVIASGHIMRCISIAKAFVKKGERVQFLISDSSSISMLNDASMDYIILNSDWENLMSDVDKVMYIVKQETNPILFIDTYQITREYVEKLNSSCYVVYLGSKQEYLGKIGMIINYSTCIDYNFYEKNYDENTKLLLGPSFAPLREEFQNINHLYNCIIKRVMITTGNTDPYNIVLDIINAIFPIIKTHDITIDVVIGNMYKSKEKIREKYGYCKNVVLHENVTKISELMDASDLAISANGTTIYELAAIGVPIISFAMVNEQVNSAESLYELGVIDYCGNLLTSKDTVVNRIKDRLAYYINNNNDLLIIANKAKELIDGNGCEKIVNMLLKKPNI